MRHCALALFLAVAAADSLVAQASGLEVLSRFTRSGTAGYSGIWGWVDPASGRELALLGLREGTVVVETTDPRNPVERGYFPGPVTPFNREITTYRTRAYVITEGGGGAQVLDLANPSAPVLVNTIMLPGWLNTHTAVVDPDRGTLWCCGTSLGMLVFDLAADPINPPLLLTWTQKYVHDAYVRRGYAYLSLVADDRLWIATTGTLPALPVIASIATPGGRTHTAWTSEDDTLLLVSADLGNGPLQLYDNTNRAAPVPLGSWADPGIQIHNHFLTDDKIVHLIGIGGPYRALDVSDRNNPRVVAKYDGLQGWGSYPYQPSGVVYLSDLGVPNGGLICVRLDCGVPQPFGRGFAGSGGHVPKSDWGGGTARLGNSGFRLEGKGMLGGATAALALGTRPLTLPVAGIEVLVDPRQPFVLQLMTASGSGPGAGTATFALPVPNDPALTSGVLVYQWLVADPGAPLGLASSPGRWLRPVP